MRLPRLLLTLAVSLAAISAATCAPASHPRDHRPATRMAAPAVPSDPVVAENEQPGDASWHQGVQHGDDVYAMSAFADRSSIAPGDPVRLYVSTTSATYRVTAHRMGWYAGAEARSVWRSEQLAGRPQFGEGFVAETLTPYAEWRPSLTILTDGWTPGMYLLRVAGSTGAEWLVPLVVRSPDVRGRLVLVMADLTWQAYNDWGGRSAYTGPAGFADRSRSVSFARPYANGHGTGKYLGYEHPVVVLAERLGLPVSYVAASDLSSGSGLLDGAEGVVSLGHSEYWSAAQRAEVVRARDAGTDLAFLGANTAYWQVRFAEYGPAGLPLMDVYKSADEDPIVGLETTARFRDRADGLSERTLVGLDYECFPATGTYTIADPSFFLFDGRVARGEEFDGLVDVEVDRAYPLPGTPANLQIVADSPTTCGGVSTVSHSAYYSTDSGAGVFAVGTMGWVLRAMRGESPSRTTRFVTSVTSSLLREMTAGPMGARHPAQGNLDRFQLWASNTTGAA